MFTRVLIPTLVFVLSVSTCQTAKAHEKAGTGTQQLRSLVTQLAADPPGHCVQALQCGQVYDTENKLFDLVSRGVLEELKHEPKNPELATNSLLGVIKSEIGGLLRNWPAQNRFAFKVSYSEMGGGWRSLFLRLKVRTEGTVASFTYTPRAAPAGENRAKGQWALDWVSTRLTGAALETFSVFVERLAANPPNDCSGPVHNSEAAVELEDRLFDLLGQAVVGAINKEPASPLKAARATLARFKAVGDEITKSWTSASRLRYQLFSFQPLIVLKLGIWNQDSFVVYAPSAHASTARWAIIQSEGDGGHQAFEKLRITSLWRGPSGNPRFLAIKHFSGCMAGMTLDYVIKGYEWHPGEPSLVTILKKQSSYSEEGPKWKLDTAGKTVQIPYCWFGALKIENVSAPICSVDTYDLSGNVIRFVRTQSDPEDLALIARVIGYAQEHDFEALRGLCESRKVARLVLELMPPSAYFAGFQRKRLGAVREQIDLSDDWNMKFTLEERKGCWKVAVFRLQQNY